MFFELPQSLRQALILLGSKLILGKKFCANLPHFLNSLKHKSTWEGKCNATSVTTHAPSFHVSLQNVRLECFLEEYMRKVISDPLLPPSAAPKNGVKYCKSSALKINKSSKLSM